MAQFNATQLTADGLILKAKGETNKFIEFTKIAVGDGVPGQGETVENLTALKAQKLQVAINSFDVLGGGISKATGIISNQGLAVGFYVREIGLFAKDPDTQAEKLYAYTYVSSAPDWLPPEGGPTLIESEIGMIAVVGNATNVTANIDDTVVVATKRDVSKILGIALDDGISQVMQGTSYVFPITDYDGFSTYAVDGWIDTTPLDPAYLYYQNEAFHLSIPNTITGSNLKMRLKKTTAGLDYYREITIPLFSGGIITPTITFPAANGTDVSTSPTLQASAFTPVPSGSQTHSQTNWQIATDANFSNLVVNVTNGTNLTSYPVPVSTLALNTKYYARVRYQGSVSGWSAWSGTVSFTTMDNVRLAGLFVEDVSQEFYSCCEDNTGNKYFCGSNNNKLYVVKTNAKFEKLAAKTYDYTAGNANGYQSLRKIIFHDGYLYACGEMKGTSIPTAFFVIKLDTSLNVVAKGSYEKTLSSGSQGFSALTDIKANGSDIYVCGHCFADGAVVREGVILRFNESLTLLNKRIYHCYNSADKSIWAGSLVVEASRIVVALPGEIGANATRGFLFVTMGRDLANPVTRITLGDGANYNSYTANVDTSLLSDGTNYYLLCLPMTTNTALVNQGFLFKIDSSFSVLAARVINITGSIPAGSMGRDTPILSMSFGVNNDLIIGGQFSYTTSNLDTAFYYIAGLTRVSRASLGFLTNLVGLKNVNNLLTRIRGFFVDTNNNLVCCGAVTTGQGGVDGMIVNQPASLTYSEFGPLPDLPELELSAMTCSVEPTSVFVTPSPAPTITTNTTFTLNSQTITLTVADANPTYYTSEF